MVMFLAHHGSHYRILMKLVMFVLVLTTHVTSIIVFPAFNETHLSI